MQSILFNSSPLLCINQYSMSLKAFLKVVVKRKDLNIYNFISHMKTACESAPSVTVGITNRKGISASRQHTWHPLQRKVNSPFMKFNFPRNI